MSDCAVTVVPSAHDWSSITPIPSLAEAKPASEDDSASMPGTNQYVAECVFGAKFMKAKREEARRAVRDGPTIART